MGIKSYFKAEKRRPPEEPTVFPASSTVDSSQIRPSGDNEKGTFPSGHGFELRPPMSTFDSSRNSTHSIQSARSIASSVFLGDIKHQVMVTHVFNQLCKARWIEDAVSGQMEGVILRKARGQYLACPDELADSPFSAACIALNVQVRKHFVPELSSSCE